MKTFFNVLYRRILYKIPLKFLLILLAVCAIFIASFSNAGFTTVEHVYNAQINDGSYTCTNCDIVCIRNDTCGYNELLFNTDHGNYGYQMYKSTPSTPSAGLGLGVCADGKSIYYSSFATCQFTVTEVIFQNYTKAECKSEYDLIEDSECTGMDSMTCQTTYNLIPISSVDQNYCTTNNLCPSGGTPSDCPDIGVSNLFINDIFHPGAFNIIMNIPEEISRDYAYTNSGYNFNLDIEGYNVDYEKMQSVIDTQSYIPTEEDFNNIVAILGPYSKIIVFFVFLFIVWAWIKKPFKSKKL